MSENAVNEPDGDELLEEVPATTVQKVAAEVLGTFVLVLFGCGVATVVGRVTDDRGSFVIATALAFGLSVMAMAYAVGRISGGHFNPAITLGAAIGGRLPWAQAPVYMGAQLVGALLGSFLLWLVLLASPVDFDTYGSNGFGDFSGLGVSWWGVAIVEIVLTFVFVVVVLGSTDRRTRASLPMAPIAIGLSLTLLHLLAIPLDGTSVNPARSISAALFSGVDAIQQVWVFILAPLVGGGIAGLVYPTLFGHGEKPVDGSGLAFLASSPKAPAQQQQQWAQQHGQWNTPQQGWVAPEGQPQQWGSPAAPAAPAGQDWGQPQTQQTQQWGAQPQWTDPNAPAQQAQQWADPNAGQWGAPQQQQWGAPAQPQQPTAPPQPAQPQQWNTPAPPEGWDDQGEDEGRTQMRPDQ